MLKSSNTVGINGANVAYALITDKDFIKAYKIARKIRDKIELMQLEGVSSINASEPKNMVERIFRLKSLNRERYGDTSRKTDANVEINITFGDGVNAVSLKQATTPTIKEELVEISPRKGKVNDDGIENIVSKIQ